MKTFFKIYESIEDATEKNTFRKRIINACCIENPTWYSWIRRGTIPKHAQKLISIELQQPIEVLFPVNDPRQ